jgi:hypothetical protein
MKFGPDGEIPGGSTFFEGSPLRTSYFRWNVILIALTLVGGLLVLVRTMREYSFPTAAPVILVSLGAVLLFLNAALRVHRRINDLYRTGAIQKPRPGDPLEVVLRGAAGMINLGLLYVSGLVGFLVLELGRALKH